jgi:hypothetical protein
MSAELESQDEGATGVRSGVAILIRITLIFLVGPMLIALAARYLF